MKALADKHPDIHAHFMSGHFVVHKTTNKFSAMAIDQCHEQNNAIVKGSGGAIGLTGNPGALRRWMVAGPEIARITTEFEDVAIKVPEQHSNSKHHEQKPAVQTRFLKEAQTLVVVLEETGNHFLEHSEDLLVIDTRDIVQSEIANTVRVIDTLGEEQYNVFVTERLEECRIPLTHPLPKNKLPLFSRPPVKCKSKEREQLTTLKSDCGLFEGFTSRVKLEMETSTTFSLMKTRLHPQLSLVEESYVLGLKLTY